MLVHMWSVGFLVPPDAAVPHGAAVHLRDDEVAVGIAPLEVLVPGGNSLDSLDAFVADALRPGGDDSREVRVVGRPAKRAECDSVDLLNLLRCVHVTPSSRQCRPAACGAVTARAL